ncbi:hypothetical protein [Halorhodospira halochloris]|uniref:hypothetical protein n=1 Tax=Halorhodospira halochloris TaxID=1052 RepID=UPI001EE7D527|nr:hypothetical protein [Halorhodospira halochloris]MCG5547588.1 hypothetical protein [Halorhodospira halochloris]
MTEENPDTPHNRQTQRALTSRDAKFPEEYRDRTADDEISLIDLWLVLLRRRWVIVGVFAATTALGSAYALTQDSEERFVTPVQIGQYMDEEGNINSLEPAQQLVTRLSESVLPAMRHRLATELAEEDPDLDTHQEAAPPSIKVTLPDEENHEGLLLLRSSAPLANTPEVELFHNNVLDLINEQHNNLLDIEKTRFESIIANEKMEIDELIAERYQRLQDLENKLEGAKDDIDEIASEHSIQKQKLEHHIADAEARIEGFEKQQEQIQEKIARLEQRREFLQGRETTLSELISDFRPAELRSLEDTESLSNVATGMMLRGSLTANLHYQLSAVREELSLGLDERRSELEDRLLRNQYNLQTVQRELAERRNEAAQLEDRFERKKSEAERKLAERELRLEQFEERFDREVQRKRNELRVLERRQDHFQPTSASVIAANIGSGDDRRSLIAALSAVLGLMLGVFGAFFAELHNRAREMLSLGQSSAEDS